MDRIGGTLYGIGAAVARAFARQGAKVLIVFLRARPGEFGIDQRVPPTLSMRGRILESIRRPG